MKKFHTALALGSLLAVAGAMAPTASSAQTVDRSYVACNAGGECWRVHHIYAYGEAAPIRYYNSDWYDAHHTDANVHWVAIPPMTAAITWKGAGTPIPPRMSWPVAPPAPAWAPPSAAW